VPLDLSIWKSLALRGGAAVLFGIITLVWPGISLLAMVLLFGAFALVHGASYVVAAAFRDPKQERRRGVLLIVQAGLGIVTGIITFLWPGITALALLYLIAAWALIMGALEIAASIRLRREINNEWMLGLSGILSLIVGVLLVLMPGAGALAITWLIGLYALLMGILLLALAFKIRRMLASVAT
jgi:uncharacterized membrane protein HdeD (DUF308 family)